MRPHLTRYLVTEYELPVFSNKDVAATPPGLAQHHPGSCGGVAPVPSVLQTLGPNGQAKANGGPGWWWWAGENDGRPVMMQCLRG
jgi:hypothetical protein